MIFTVQPVFYKKKKKLRVHTLSESAYLTSSNITASCNLQEIILVDILCIRFYKTRRIWLKIVTQFHFHDCPNGSIANPSF